MFRCWFLVEAGCFTGAANSPSVFAVDSARRSVAFRVVGAQVVQAGCCDWGSFFPVVSSLPL